MVRRFSLTQAIAVLVGAGSFWLSFTALSDLAETHFVEVGQGWIFALTVDATIIGATRGVVVLTDHRWYGWFLLAVTAGVSTAGNVAHVWERGAGSACMAAVPPLLLLAMAHLCVVRAADRASAAAALAEPVTIPAPAKLVTMQGGDPKPEHDPAARFRASRAAS